jgi:uncharacterized protein
MPVRAFGFAALLAMLAAPTAVVAQISAPSPGAGVVLPPQAGGPPQPAPSPTSAAAAPNPDADLAFGAYQRGMFATALREATARVSSNPADAPAMTLIGEIYRDGVTVKRDDAEAARWYRLASDLGDRAAQFQLGMMLLQGAEGVNADRAGAKVLLEKAAAQGHSGALYNLAVVAIEGDADSKPDFTKAADLFHRAAEAGDDNAAYSYGILLRQGRGVPLDIGEAAVWLKRASDGGIIAGQVEYAIMLFNGIGVDKDEAGAAKLFTKAAAHNNPIAQNRLAHLYANGRGVPKDLVRAAAWQRFAKAAGIEDKELDATLDKLPPQDQAKVEEFVRRQVEY